MAVDIIRSNNNNVRTIIQLSGQSAIRAMKVINKKATPTKKLKKAIKEAKKSRSKVKIIQNAIMCPDGTILNSVHRHDCQQHGDYMVDGGKDYLRRGQPVGKEKATSLVLTDHDSIVTIEDKLLWGTLGKDGKGPLTFVFLKDCETDHLESILEIPSISPLHRYIIGLILEKRD